jgi:hypothetical protein
MRLTLNRIKQIKKLTPLQFERFIKRIEGDTQLNNLGGLAKIRNREELE